MNSMGLQQNTKMRKIRALDARCGPEGVRQREQDHREEEEGSVSEPAAAGPDRREIVEWRGAAAGGEDDEERPHHQSRPNKERQQNKRPHGDSVDRASDARPKHRARRVSAIKLSDWEEIQPGNEKPEPAGSTAARGQTAARRRARVLVKSANKIDEPADVPPI